MTKDKYRFVSVNLRVFGYKDEPFIFAKDVQQVLVCGYAWEKRIVGVENVVEEEEYNQFDEIPSFDSSYMPRLLANDKTPYL